MNAARKLLRWTPAQWLLMVHAVSILLLVVVGLRCSNFRRVRSALEKWQTLRSQVSPLRRSGIEEIIRFVVLGSRIVPTAALCLPRALAAWHLLELHRHAPELLFGVARDGQGVFKAHAWVECDGEVVIGREELREFSRLR